MINTIKMVYSSKIALQFNVLGPCIDDMLLVVLIVENSKTHALLQ